VAMGLGQDSKSVHKLMDSGRMPVRRLPSDAGDVCRVVDRRAFLAWLCNPEHWCYFRQERVGRKHPRGQRGFTGVYDDAFWKRARRLLDLRRARWDDAWLTPGQAGRLRGASDAAINNAIHAGRLAATRWGNWWIRRSDLLALPRIVVYHGKGGQGQSRRATPAAEAFMLLAAAMGLPPAEIAPLARLDAKYVDHRLRALRRTRGAVAGLIRRFKLPVEFDARSGALWADWRTHAARFPRLARVMRAFADGRAIRHQDVGIVRGVLHAWASWQTRRGATQAQREIEKRLRKFGGRHTADSYRRIVEQMIAAGLGNPLRGVKSK